MSRSVVQIAAPHGNKSAVEAAAVAMEVLAPAGRCIRRYVPHVAPTPKCRSSLDKIDPFIVASATAARAAGPKRGDNPVGIQNQERPGCHDRPPILMGIASVIRMSNEFSLAKPIQIQLVRRTS
jgi:hypothetical protein